MTTPIVLAIVLYPGMTALDAIGPYEVLRTFPEIELRFVWKTIGPIVTDSHMLVLGATHRFEDTPKPDIILVPGSSGDTAVMMADDDVLAWIRSAHQHTMYTTSVCTGSLILAAAGILKGHPATTHWFAMDTLKLFGAIAKPQSRVVVSGKIVTAAGVSAGIDMALTLAGELFGQKRAQHAQLWVEYDPHPPFDAGHPSKVTPQMLKETKYMAMKESLNARTVGKVPKLLIKSMKQHLTSSK